MARKILIVDDISLNRKILSNGLSKEYLVVEAGDGAEALTIIRRDFKQLSAVVLDLFMPVMDGYAVLRAVRDNPLLAQLPILVITASEDDNARMKALELGANDFITKPYNLSIVRHCLRNSIALREAASIVNAIQCDKLTGIYNREVFFEKAGELIRALPPESYLFVCYDIDNFKLVNDQYGAAEGDRILQHMGAALKSVFQSVGGICGRISGDNFAGLHPNTPAAIAAIEQARLNAFLPADTNTRLQISMGYSLVSDCSLPASAIYDRAYIAKQSVKGRYDKHEAGFDHSMLELLIRQQQIISDMSGAIARREFEVWYQPQYNHASGAVIGAEALVRWRHPRKGLMLPHEFIPVFEENGFIYELDKYVWEEACKQMQQWLENGYDPLPVSVNVSRYDMFREDLTQVLPRLAEKYHIPPEQLRLEITESAFTKTTEQIISVVQQLISKGFIIEIDDFGSGYSSLNTLKDVPAQVVKLDMRLLESNGVSPRGGNILQSVVRMAKWLGMSVIAEGVETAAQANFLKSIGCIYVQGYLYAKPSPVEEFQSVFFRGEQERQLLRLKTLDNMDNNAFWDPNSMDTLIFNSYVGGAGVYEFHHERIELLRANDKFIRTIGSAGLTLSDAMKLDWAQHLAPGSLQSILRELDNSLATRQEFSGEYLFYDLPGCPHETYLRSTLRVIASMGDYLLVYCSNENVTALRQAQKKEQQTEARRYAAAQRLQAILDHVNCGITAAVLREDRLELLFANNKYYSILGFTEPPDPDSFEGICKNAHPDDRQAAQQALDAALHTHEGSVLEYRVNRPDGSLIWLRAEVTVADFFGLDAPVVLCVYSDITSERDSDQQLRFLNRMARELLAQPDIQVGVEGVLRSLMEYFGGERAYVFELDYSRDTANNTYEVCAPGVSREIGNLQGIPLRFVQYWLDAFEQQDYIYIPDASALDESRREERQTLLSQGIRSLIAVPLKRDGELFGFIGVDDLRKHRKQIPRLAALGDYVAVMLTRRDLTEKIRQDNEIMSGLMNDTPGGFVRMQLLPEGKIVPLYFNEGFCKLVGMDLPSLMELYGNDAYAGVHPDDLAIVSETVHKMLNEGEASSTKYRLQCGTGSYVWVMFFGRLTHNAGKTYLNIYYTDASELNKAELLQRELLDNLPCGAGIYIIQGDSIRATYLNRRYRAIIGREIGDLDSAPVLEMVHPEDAGVLQAALQTAIAKQEQNATCELRIANGEGGYIPFRLVGNIVARSDGSTAIYVTYTPISRGELSYREVLPLVLSAIMESSSDLTFAKDKDFRYICGSRAFANMTGLDNEAQLVGKTDYDLFPQELADKYRRDDEALLANGNAIVDMVEAIPSADGIPHYSNTSKYLLRDTQNNIIGLYGVGRDITTYRDAFDKLRLISNSIPGGMVSLLCSGTPLSAANIRVAYFNDGICRLFGMTRREYEEFSAKSPAGHILKDDLPALIEQINALLEHGAPINCTCRVNTPQGIKWISLYAASADRQNSTLLVHILLMDVTEQQAAIEKLRLSEEENRLAIQHTGNVVCRFSVADRVLTMPASTAALRDLPERITDMPYGMLRRGKIAKESERAYISFYEGIIRGNSSGSLVCKSLMPSGWRWMDVHYSTVFSNSGEPVSAVITFSDVTERLEKENVYKRWQQSLQERPIESYTLFRCNLNKSAAFEAVEGSLLQFDLHNTEVSLNRFAAEYARTWVLKEDRKTYLTLLNSDALLAGYYRGRRYETLEYRELLPDGELRWLRLSIELVESASSTDVEAYLMYENIDSSKKEELQTLLRAQTDSLTGVLNRKTFAEQMNRMLENESGEGLYALLMLDLDCFKLVNDSFGHATGDETLIEIGQSISSVLRSRDLLGRLGGDEFVVCLSGLPDRQVIANKARQICTLLRKSFSQEVQLSVSIGIAVCPDDGRDFDALYKMADSALYSVKSEGKDNYAFYQAEMIPALKASEDGAETGASHFSSVFLPRRRMLIVEDNASSRAQLINIFKDDFLIDTAANGERALEHLRVYGSAICVVLLDLLLPGTDGFTVLEKMQEQLLTVPVIVVSSMDERKVCLKAIRFGAFDFVTKPIDPELLRLRVQSAISRTENERLRAQNRYLALCSSDVERYRAALEGVGTALAEYNTLTNDFTYDRGLSTLLAGHYDERPLWEILRADGVAAQEDIDLLYKCFTAQLAAEAPSQEQLTMALKTPDGTTRSFCVRLRRLPSGTQLLLIFTNTATASAPSEPEAT